MLNEIGQVLNCDLQSWCNVTFFVRFKDRKMCLQQIDIFQKSSVYDPASSYPEGFVTFRDKRKTLNFQYFIDRVFFLHPRQRERWAWLIIYF